MVQLLKHAEQAQKLNGRKGGHGRSNAGNGAYALAADLTIGLTKPSAHLYRTPDWNHSPLVKEENRMSFSSASPAERKSNLTMVGSLDDMPVSPITILRTAR